MVSSKKTEKEAGVTLEKILETETKELTDLEIDVLVDAATELDIVGKECVATVKMAKAVLLQHAKTLKWKTRATDKSICKIGPNSSSEIGVKDLAKLLKKMEKSALFVDLVKVKITDAKKYLGEHSLAPITVTDTEEYGSVSLKSSKK